MANETVICVVGNLTADPVLTYTQNGLPVVDFTIASTPRVFDRQSNEWKDQDALFLRCSAWRESAEHIAQSLTKGMRVIAQGNLEQRSYQDREGNNRTSVELNVQEVGPSLRYAVAQVTRGGKDSTPRSSQEQVDQAWTTPGASSGGGDSWATPEQFVVEEAPF